MTTKQASTASVAVAHQPLDRPAPTDLLRGRAARLALLAVMFASFMDLLDATIVTVAGPALSRDLGASPAQLQWVLAAYTLALGSGLITGGRLGDNYGRRRMFLLSLSGFVVASVLCASAAGPAMLIAMRAVQGAAAGVMVPQVFGVIRGNFAPSEHAKAFGTYGAVQGLAAAAGPLLGGLLVDSDVFGLQWRTIFWVNVPVGVLALVLGRRVLPESAASGATRFDVRGVVVSVAALLAVLVPLVQGREWGWPSWSFVVIAAGVAGLGVFIRLELALRRRGGQPLIEPALLRVRSLAAGLGASLLFFGAIGAFFLTLSVFLQDGTGRSAWSTGLIILPYAVGSFLTSGVGVALARRAGRGLLVAGAIVLAASQLVLLLEIERDVIGYWPLAAALFVGGLGLGLTAPILVNVVLVGVPARDAGAAGGVLSTVTQLGSAVGVAILGTVFFTALEQPAHGREHSTAQVLAPFADAMSRVLIWEIALYLLAAAAMLFLPRTDPSATPV